MFNFFIYYNLQKRMSVHNFHYLLINLHVIKLLLILIITKYSTHNILMKTKKLG